MSEAFDGPLDGPLDGAVHDLVDLLDVERVDPDLFRGRVAHTTRTRVFGGQVAAQALIAAIRTTGEGFAVHSLHSYFLLPGDPAQPIDYEVERLRDGRSFETRRVAARQGGRSIYFLTANFQIPEDGFDHQDLMPQAPPPESGVDLAGVMRAGGSTEAEALAKEWAALEVRWVGNSHRGLPEDLERPSKSQMWVRIAGALPDDASVHLAAFTYASDISLLGAALAAHPVPTSTVQMASLDHTIWFHRPFRADQWWLYDQWSPSAHGARGLSLGRVFTAEGVLVATVAQEGLIRPKRER